MWKTEDWFDREDAIKTLEPLLLDTKEKIYDQLLKEYDEDVRFNKFEGQGKEERKKYYSRFLTKDNKLKTFMLRFKRRDIELDKDALDKARNISPSACELILGNQLEYEGELEDMLRDLKNPNHDISQYLGLVGQSYSNIMNNNIHQLIHTLGISRSLCDEYTNNDWRMGILNLYEELGLSEDDLKEENFASPILDDVRELQARTLYSHLCEIMGLSENKMITDQSKFKNLLTMTDDFFSERNKDIVLSALKSPQFDKNYSFRDDTHKLIRNTLKTAPSEVKRKIIEKSLKYNNMDIEDLKKFQLGKIMETSHRYSEKIQNKFKSYHDFTSTKTAKEMVYGERGINSHKIDINDPMFKAVLFSNYPGKFKEVAFYMMKSYGKRYECPENYDTFIAMDQIKNVQYANLADMKKEDIQDFNEINEYIWARNKKMLDECYNDKNYSFGLRNNIPNVKNANFINTSLMNGFVIFSAIIKKGDNYERAGLALPLCDGIFKAMNQGTCLVTKDKEDNTPKDETGISYIISDDMLKIFNDISAVVNGEVIHGNKKNNIMAPSRTDTISLNQQEKPKSNINKNGNSQKSESKNKNAKIR